MSQQEVPVAFRSSISADGTLLNLSGKKLTSLPNSIGDLTSLTTLDLTDNQLTSLPNSIGNLTALTTLKLSHNRLAALPGTIGNLTALSDLHLDGNWLTTLPDSIGSLTSLTFLELTHNRLTALPESIGNLAVLKTLYLFANRLLALPESIGNLTSLTSLYLFRNQLTDLPASIGNCADLTELDLRSNELTILPKQLATLLIKGLHLQLSDNPLAEPLPELAMRGADALATYLDSLEDVGLQYQAKMLLVGEGNVGKTSLVAALAGLPFRQNRSTTHGIEVSPLTFHHPSLDLEMTLWAWDSGGQEVYRVTHQFFFSRRTLYLVVWHAREGQEQNEVENWLRRIRLRAGRDARVIVVATHCEERLPELDYRSIKRRFPGMLLGSFEVDNKTRLGLPELSTAIGAEAAKLPQMGLRISRRWASARDEILGLAKSQPQIPYETFVEICHRNRVTEQEIGTLAELMHDLGQIIYYSEDEGLKDIVVLNPEWLTKAISYVLEDRPTRDSGGVLDHVRLKEIWRRKGKGLAYPPQYHPYFLRLMEKFDVSYRLADDPLRSLVAQLVPHERPVLPWDSVGGNPEHPVADDPEKIRALTLICRMSEPVPGLIPWLTVRHHRASTGMHWRRGVFLRHPVRAYASEALLELCDDDHLMIEVRAPSPDMYFNVLRDSVEDLITHRWPGLAYRLIVPCPNLASDGSRCSGQFPLESLLRLRQRGRKSIPCMECTKEYELALLLTGFATPGQSLTDQLGRIEDHISELAGHAKVQAAAVADIAYSVRRMLQVVSTEVTDCPRLFTLELEESPWSDRIRFYENRYRLTLWCEHSGCWHPWEPATYQLHEPKEWFVKIGPYASLALRVLHLVVPPAGSIFLESLPPGRAASAQARVQVMDSLLADLPSRAEQRPNRVGGLYQDESELTPAEGQALRAIRTILFDYDRSRTFGGMRRVQAPSGELLWVCPDHYQSDYDSGLPTVP